MGKEIEVTQKTELQTTESESARLIEMAITGKADLDKLEKLLLLRRQEDAEAARKMFFAAMTRVHGKISTVSKELKNSQTNSRYASLDEIIRETKNVYTAEGFSIIFSEGDAPSEGKIRILADVLHAAGHERQYHYDCPLDGVGIKGNANMTLIHGKASAVSYSRRYLMCMIWNIPTGDDNDGNTATAETIISDEQKSKILDLITDTNSNLDKFLSAMKCDSLETFPASKFKQAILALETKKNRAVKK